MSLQDIEPYEDALAEVARGLKERGSFIFSIPHPCFEEIVKDREGWRNISGTGYDERKESANEADSTQVETAGYFGSVRYEVLWTMERISKPFKTVSFHKTLTDYFQALHKNGLLVSSLLEPRSTLKAASRHLSLVKRLKNPQSVIVEALKANEAG